MKDKNFILEALEQNPSVINYLNDDLKNDQEILGKFNEEMKKFDKLVNTDVNDISRGSKKKLMNRLIEFERKKLLDD